MLTSHINPAISIPVLALFHLTKHILHSHPRLDESDVFFASNYIASFYSHSLDKKISISLSHDQLVMFLVYADQNSLCRFALLFNETLDSSIKSRDTFSLKRLILGPKEMFVELYDNPLLSSSDRSLLIRTISRYSFALSLTLQSLENNISNFNFIDDSSTSESFSSHLRHNVKSLDLFSIHSKCFDQVCIHDSKILDDDTSRAIMSIYESPSSSIFTVDKPSLSPQVFCFDLLDLVSSFVHPVPINSKTNKPFSPYTVDIISHRFHKEINMYRRYHQLKNSY